MLKRAERLYSSAGMVVGRIRWARIKLQAQQRRPSGSSLHLSEDGLPKTGSDWRVDPIRNHQHIARVSEDQAVMISRVGPSLGALTEPEVRSGESPPAYRHEGGVLMLQKCLTRLTEPALRQLIANADSVPHVRYKFHVTTIVGLRDQNAAINQWHQGDIRSRMTLATPEEDTEREEGYGHPQPPQVAANLSHIYTQGR